MRSLSTNSSKPCVDGIATAVTAAAAVAIAITPYKQSHYAIKLPPNELSTKHLCTLHQCIDFISNFFHKVEQ